jgi:recombinational DNA repair ATPase RecF
MKLESISIRDFRCIESLDLSFTDDLDLIRDRVPIVGPNTSGKTTILDAIALSLMPVTEPYRFREGLRLSPPALVRSGAARAHVSANVWFSDDEIEATMEVLDRSGFLRYRPFAVPPVNRVTVHWMFPDPEGRHRTGVYGCIPDNGWLLFRGRKVLANHLHVPGLGPRQFQRIGSIVMFDQQRTGLSKRLSSYDRRLLSHLLDPLEPEDGEREDGDDSGDSGAFPRPEQRGYDHTTDPRLILTSLAMRAQVAQDPEATEREDFARLKQLYEHVCRPHTIGELHNTEHGLDMEFRSDRGRYYYDGLSSGQQMILLMLLQFATRRIHRSIVLIDELELHLHPLWQDRLYTALPRLGEDNQYIFTTHSTHLRDTIGDQFYHATGEITEPAVTS